MGLTREVVAEDGSHLEEKFSIGWLLFMVIWFPFCLIALSAFGVMVFLEKIGERFGIVP